jgi:error-prone DNA polymerase
VTLDNMSFGRGRQTNTEPPRLYVLAPDRERYKNLSRLITASKLRIIGRNADGSPQYPGKVPSGDQREKAIQYVYRRYGERGAAMTANVIIYRVRSAVRETAKVLGFPPDQVDRLAKLNYVYEFHDQHDEFTRLLRKGGVDPEAPRMQMLAEIVRRLQGLPRHLGQHSGGMVIGGAPLDEIVPLEPATMPGRVVIQWDKDDCADLGIIKIDLLGLGMLAVLEEALPLVREHEHLALDLAHLPADDPQVYAMLQKADTVGVSAQWPRSHCL